MSTHTEASCYFLLSLVNTFIGPPRVLEISYEKNTTGGIGLMIKAFYDVGEPRPKLPSWLKRDWLVLREGRCSNYSPESANSRIQPGHQTYNTTSSEYVGTVGPIMQAVMRNGSINKYFLTAGHTLNDFAEGLIIRQPHSLTGEAVASVLNSFRRIGRRPVWRLAETEGMLDDVCICKISESDSELFHGIITCIDCHKFSFEDNTDSVMRSPISNPRVRGLLQQILVSGSIGVFKAGAMTSVESATRRGVTDRNKNRSTLVNDMSEANDPLNNPNPSTSYSGVQNPQRVEVTVCTLAVMAVVDFAYFLCQAQITLPPVSSWHCT